MSSQVDNIISAYKILSKVPSIIGGNLNHGGNRISSKWSVRNIDKGKYTKYTYNFFLNNNLDVDIESDFGTDVSNELLSSVSPRETFKAIIRQEKDKKDVKKHYLEVWQRNNLVHAIDLTALDIHGDVYADSEFGGLEWNQDENAVVYVAEKKKPKFEPYIKRKCEDHLKDDGSGEKPTIKGEEYLYRQDWGEQLVGKYMSVIVICHLHDESFSVLEGLPESWCPGQVRFAPDGKSVVGVAWETEPRRLGLIFCTNRLGYIFNLTLDGKMYRISEEGLAVRSPRINSVGDIVWLERTAGGPHHACHRLVMNPNDSGEIRTIIDIVQTEMEISGAEKFYGVYSQSLPKNCFSSDGKFVIFSTPQQNEIRSYAVAIDTGEIFDISNKTQAGSTSVLDVKGDIVLASFSSITTPAELYVARLPQNYQEQIVWKQVSKHCDVPVSITSSTVQYLQLSHDSSDTVKSFSALFVSPKPGNKKLPLIVWPHGGPHSGFVNAYSLETALFNMLGFAALQINYRGSTGAGQSTIDFLLKRIGDTDVKDCKLATDAALKTNLVDEKKICLFGGSHGGFLVTHLSGQYPDVYSVVVSRNPVTDVATMISSTDIADWCAVEAGFDFRESGPVSEEELIAMRRRSPLAYVHRVKAPTALMLGSIDKRVPYYQGLEYSRRLKANGVPTSVYMYEDNHSLSSLAVEMDNLINAIIWFLENLPSHDG